ncbi:hypothetical protein PCE1_001592 [Barthelona sp. PCE]
MFEEIDGFSKWEVIGKGTYGEVFKTSNLTTGEQYAIKRFYSQNADEGVTVTTLRELKVFSEIQHPNVVNCHGVFLDSTDSLCIAMDLMQTDIEQFVRNSSYISKDDRLYIFKLMLEGLSALHAVNYVHRDIKLNNYLLSRESDVVLTDFSFTINTSDADICIMTPQVNAKNHRAPELLLGAKVYTEDTDIWALGCCFAELLLKNPLFPNEGSDISLLSHILRLIGSPNEESWESVDNLPSFTLFKRYLGRDKYRNKLSERFSGVSAEEVDLLSRMLQWDPNSRSSAEELLELPIFDNVAKQNLDMTYIRETEVIAPPSTIRGMSSKFAKLLQFTPRTVPNETMMQLSPISVIPVGKREGIFGNPHSNVSKVLFRDPPKLDDKGPKMKEQRVISFD